jgi:hypothetical protein
MARYGLEVTVVDLELQILGQKERTSVRILWRDGLGLSARLRRWLCFWGEKRRKED